MHARRASAGVRHADDPAAALASGGYVLLGAKWGKPGLKLDHASLLAILICTLAWRGALMLPLYTALAMQAP